MTQETVYPKFYRCPICYEPFTTLSASWQCDNGHHFDRAKQGYIHLLPVQHKKSKTPGDDQSMVDARRQFLAAGFYEPLQVQLQKTISELAQKELHLLDIGCGEGYYTHALAFKAKQTSDDAWVTAFDISKSAVIKTAKQKSPNTVAMVASAANIPLLDNSVEIATSIFAPIIAEECHRVIKENGFLIIAKPDTNHLIDIRNHLFDTVELHDSDKFIQQLSPRFELQNTKNVSAELILNPSSMKDLLTMTPYAYKAKPEKIEALLSKDNLQTFANFKIYVFQKVG